MHAEEHSTVREGLVTGLLGASVVAVWYFLVDSAAGQPFHTPNVLGKILFRGRSAQPHSSRVAIDMAAPILNRGSS